MFFDPSRHFWPRSGSAENDFSKASLQGLIKIVFNISLIFNIKCDNILLNVGFSCNADTYPLFSSIVQADNSIAFVTP